MNQDQQQQQYQQVIGAIKIKDGLFIGDEFASKKDSLLVQKSIINYFSQIQKGFRIYHHKQGQEIPNIWENAGVQYLTFPWMEDDLQSIQNQVIVRNNKKDYFKTFLQFKKILFDHNDENIKEIYSFVEESVEMGESTLVHSVRGQSRSCCVLAAYFMKKFKWTLYKTLEFLNTRRPDLEIRASFFHQLTALEQKLARQGEGAKSSSWQELSDDTGKIESEELLVRNTFLNARNAPIADIFSDPQANFRTLNKNVKVKLRWKDNGLNDRSKLNYEEIPYENYEMDIKNEKRNNQNKKNFVKSCIKGSGKLIRVSNTNSNNTSVMINNEIDFSQKENISLRSSSKHQSNINVGNNFSMIQSNILNNNQQNNNQKPQINSYNANPQLNLVQQQQLQQQQQQQQQHHQLEQQIQKQQIQQQSYQLQQQQSQQQPQQQQQQIQQSKQYQQQSLTQSKKPLIPTSISNRTQNNIQSANGSMLQGNQYNQNSLKQNMSAKCILDEGNPKESFLESQLNQLNQQQPLPLPQYEKQQQSSSFILSDSKPPTSSKFSSSNGFVSSKDSIKQTPPLKNFSQSIKATPIQNSAPQKQSTQSKNTSPATHTISGNQNTNLITGHHQHSSSLLQKPLTAQSPHQIVAQNTQFNHGNKNINRSSSLSNFENENSQTLGGGISQLRPSVNYVHQSLERPTTLSQLENNNNKSNLKLSSNGQPYQFLSPNNNNVFSQNKNQMDFSNSITNNLPINNIPINKPSNTAQQQQQNQFKKEYPSPISNKYDESKNKQRSYTTSVLNNNYTLAPQSQANIQPQNDNNSSSISANKNKYSGLTSPLPLAQQQMPSSANQQYRSNSVPKKFDDNNTNSNNTSIIGNTNIQMKQNEQNYNMSNASLSQNKRPLSASSKDQKENNFINSQSQLVPNSTTNQRLNISYNYQPLSNKNSFYNQIDISNQQTKSATYNSNKDLLYGISPNNHNQLVNPHKPYQRGESPSIKQKEKMQKQHQLKVQKNQQQNQQQQTQQKRNTYVSPNAQSLNNQNSNIHYYYHLNQFQQIYNSKKVRSSIQQIQNPLATPTLNPNDKVANENQIYSLQQQHTNGQQILQSQYLNALSAKKPPTSKDYSMINPQNNNNNYSNNYNNSNNFSNNANLNNSGQSQLSQNQNPQQSQTFNILREQDTNKIYSQNVQEQMNQINQISNNLMKNLLNYQPQSTTSYQNINNNSVKNTGNSSGFIKQNGGPVRATGEFLQNSNNNSNNFKQYKYI